MGELNPIGKLLIAIGLLFLVIGGILLLGDRIPFIGRLPGDIYIKRKGFIFYFPLVTCILISLVLTLLMWLIGRR